MQAHSKEILLPVDSLYCLQASITVASGYLRLSGTNSSRSGSFAACSDTARFTWSVFIASLRMPGTTPTVEIVICLAPRPRSRLTAWTAVQTASKFASGSPMPMSTDVVELAPVLRLTAPRGDHDLLDDLSRTELPTKARVSRGAEAAAHRATGLARDAHGRAVAISHEHRLDALVVARLEQPLQRGASVRDALGDTSKSR